MNYRALTNLIGAIFLLLFIGWCFMIFKTMGWAEILGCITGVIILIVFKRFRNWWFKS